MSNSQVVAHNINEILLPVTVSVAAFHGASGVGEFHLILQPTDYGSIAEQLEWVRDAYASVQASLGLEADSGVFRRFFCSDLPNQATALTACSFADPAAQDDGCAVSWVGQPPTAPAKVALWAYHINDPAGLRKCKTGTSLALQREGLTHHWSTGITSATEKTSYAQTQDIFSQYDEYLQRNKMCLAENMLRTWFFVQDIDANYQGLVEARRAIFADNGMTSETHFCTSTGIEGRAADVTATVLLDAYAIAGVQQKQISYLVALDHLSPANLYGVTFERGTAIAYQDRVQVMISGTASIDRCGHIVHPGAVLLQLERTLENIAALLQQVGATLEDVVIFIVYLRDMSDMEIVRQKMHARFGAVPVQVVLAAVCRPGWLVEIECQAVISAENPSLPEF